MADRPIHFSAPMVRALLDGRKTQTRRVLKPQPPTGLMPECFAIAGEAQPIGARWSRGDRLWVRENWQALSHGDYLPTKSQPCDLRYAATEPLACLTSEVRGYPWRPSIHMPRWASRLTLTVTDVRVQRLQDISEADARAEGVSTIPEPNDLKWEHYSPHGVAFVALWNSIHGPGAWDANQWVAAYTFTVHRCNIDQMEADHG